MSVSHLTKSVSYLSEITDQYDAYIFDVWGTLHDGQVIYPGVLECLRQLKQQDKIVCFLSNSPSRIQSLVNKLASEFNITPDLYNFAYNSGEAAYEALRDRKDEFHSSLGLNYYLIGLEMHKANLADLPYRMTDFAEANFIYISRTLDLDESIEDYEDLLKQGAARKMPLLCANPDRTVGVGDQLHVCAGALAARYQAMGGTVFYHGKPYPAVYDTVTEKLAALDVRDKSKILAVGDGLPTDIKGGFDYGLDTLFITDGIHKDGNHLSLFAEHGCVPTYATRALQWSSAL